jgi:hypothetical protein
MLVSRPLIYLALCGFAISAQATMIQVNPAAYAPGSDISNVFRGVTLSNMAPDPNGIPVPDANGILQLPIAYSPIYAVDCSPCRRDIDGKTVFGTAPSGPDSVFFWDAQYTVEYLEGHAGDRYPSWNVLRADFDQPTNHIELIGGGASNGNFFRFDVWGTDGTHLARCTTGDLVPVCGATSSGPAGDDELKWSWSFDYNSGEANIGYITAGGWAGGQYVQSFAFDHEVPEPATFAMFTFGLLAMFASVRVRRPYRL